MILSPKKSDVIAAKTKKGPKGIVPPKKRNFFHITSMIETAAPVKKAKYKQRIISGNPKKRPKIKDNFTSPKPIPFPIVIANSDRKKSNAERPLSMWFKRGALTLNK